jgi:hypothetical protein
VHVFVVGSAVEQQSYVTKPRHIRFYVQALVELPIDLYVLKNGIPWNDLPKEY